MGLDMYVSRLGDHAFLQLHGSIDLEACPRFRREVQIHISDTSLQEITLDLYRLEVMGSLGVSIILSAYDELQQRGGHLWIVGCPLQTIRIFSLLRVDMLLGLAERLDDHTCRFFR